LPWERPLKMRHPLLQGRGPCGFRGHPPEDYEKGVEGIHG
jgi:hypothetical protein